MFLSLNSQEKSRTSSTMEFDGNRQPKHKASQMGDRSLSPREPQQANNKRKHEFSEDKLPPGFRFCPRDEELVGYYLKKKIMNEVLACNKIVEVDLYKHNPEDLAEKYKRLFGEKELYFFTPRDRKYPNGTRPNRAVGDGYWKATRGDKLVMIESVIVGFKKALVFYREKPPMGIKTNWIMYEYRLKDPPRNKSSVNDMRLDDWVLCSMYKKGDKESTVEYSSIAREEGENELKMEPVGLMAPVVEPGGSTAEENQDKFWDFTTDEPMIRLLGNVDLGNNGTMPKMVEPVSHNDGTSMPKMVEPMSHNDGTSMAEMVEPVGFVPPMDNDSWSTLGEIQENNFDLTYLLLPSHSNCIDPFLDLDYNFPNN